MSNEVLFFGCAGVPGHYLYGRGMRSLEYESSPWGMNLDSGLLASKEQRRSYEYANSTKPTGEYVVAKKDGWTAVAKKDGWTAVAFWDRSGDSRPASNSAFLIAKDISGEELLSLAAEQFPRIFARKDFPIAVPAKPVMP